MLNYTFNNTVIKPETMRVSDCKAITESIIFQNKLLLVIIALLLIYILREDIKKVSLELRRQIKRLF